MANPSYMPSASDEAVRFEFSETENLTSEETVQQSSINTHLLFTARFMEAKRSFGNMGGDSTSRSNHDTCGTHIALGERYEIFSEHVIRQHIRDELRATELFM